MNPTNEQLIAAHKAANDSDREWRNQFHKSFGDKPKVSLFSTEGKGLDKPKSDLAKSWNAAKSSTANWLYLMDARMSFVKESQAKPCPTPSTTATSNF